MQTVCETEEVHQVLSSKAFSDAPVMARLLKYLCDHYFSESKRSLNEYRIGVEALGRPEDFDPSKNSCVRVEMHRLRARLKKYYATEGADHELKITLEEGRYGIRFVSVEDPSASTLVRAEEPRFSVEEPDATAATQPPTEETAATAPVEAPPSRRFSHPKTIWMAIAAGILLVLIVSAWLLLGIRSRSKATQNAQAATIPGVAGAASPDNGALLMLTGHSTPKYIDHDGRIWGPDRYFAGGEAVSVKLPYIQGTSDPAIYDAAREGDFSYDIPLKPGTYELRLHFVETTFGPGTYTGRGESSRLFSVLLDDRTILKSLDIISEAGGNFRAFTKVFKGISPDSKGMVHLKFVREFDQPMVNAIELVPEAGAKMNPVRIVMQDNSYVDRSGEVWSSDQYAIGGVLANHQNEAMSVADSGLYAGERFGHFLYQIPVPQGHYTVRLFFTEGFFGSESSLQGNGARVFDVNLNGRTLLANFDIYKAAGGPNKPLVETFHGIEPNGAGLIALSFEPVTNYACVSAIEVTDEAE